MKIKCEYCGKEFKFYPYERNKRKFCSLNCYWNSMKGIPKPKRHKCKEVIIKCKNCGIKVKCNSIKKKFCDRCEIMHKKEWRKKWKAENKDKIKEYNKRYREKDKEKTREYKREEYKRNKKTYKKYKKEYDKRPEVMVYRKKYIKEYQKNNKEKRNKYSKNRRETDVNYKLACDLRSRFLLTLRTYTKTGKIMSSKKYGIDYKTIIEYLKPFPEDYLTSKNKYDIHHKKPLFTFNFVNPDSSTNLKEVRKAFAPENHIILTKEEHREIHRKLNHNLLR